VNRLPIMLSLVALLLAGCSSLNVGYDYDEEVDFSSYRTYRWIRTPSNPGNESQKIVSLQDRRVREAVDRELEAKGIRMDAAKPDLLVAYRATVRDQTRVYDTGYYRGGYGYRRSYWSGGGVQVYQYQEGSLIVDLIDADLNQVVWRGNVKGVLGDHDSALELINDAVTKMFKNYPPPGR
jgi:uncharacterized protein DUF4136